ncbi:MAG: hypothetical protein ACR2KN_03330 [Geodermatophilaceae bacterium]
MGVHLVGGLVGTIGVGFLATAAAPNGVDGLFYGGGVDQLWRQTVGALTVLVTSFVLSYLIGIAIEKTMGFRITEEEELTGIDTVAHAESAYELAGFGGAGAPAAFANSSESAVSSHGGQA